MYSVCIYGLCQVGTRGDQLLIISGGLDMIQKDKLEVLLENHMRVTLSGSGQKIASPPS